ncbi:hypothetical protein CLOP_g16363 [Closterium sp. NIES-67]|nr:hypothetical protein CLOP_g16363 [Closterium sp. NIES-67]
MDVGEEDCLRDLREGCEWVASQSTHCTIDDRAVEALADALCASDRGRSTTGATTAGATTGDASVQTTTDATSDATQAGAGRSTLRLPPWNFDGVHFYDGGPLTVQYLLLLDALNFCFWPDPSLHYEHLASGLRAAVQSDPSSIDAARLAALDVPGLRALLGPKPFPLEQQRVQAARQVGQVLLRRFSGSAVNMVVEAGGSAERLVRLLTAHFTYFQDHAIYRGRQVALFKRAQIFVADVWGAFNGRGLGHFSDVHSLTMFADYIVPAVLRSRGVLKYAEGLAQSVDGRQQILAGSEKEVEVRACCIVATERLRVRLERRVGKQVLSVELDWLLWSLGMESTAPLCHHRTMTIYY